LGVVNGGVTLVFVAGTQNSTGLTSVHCRWLNCGCTSENIVTAACIWSGSTIL
jgi:hypothetical protein